MKKISGVISALLALIILGSVFAFEGVFAVSAEEELLYYQLPSFESLSTVQLALVYKENFIRSRITKDVHPEGREKSVEVTLGSPDGTSEYTSFTISSVTAADKEVTYFDMNAHELPRGGEVFGDASLVGADGLSIWVGNYPANGKIKMQLSMAPCRGPISSNTAFKDYDEGFTFESAEVTPKDGVANFYFADFSKLSTWVDGDIYDYIDKINAVTLIFTPGAGNAAYNSKFNFGDLSAFKVAKSYSILSDDELVSGTYSFTATALSEDADITVDIDGNSFAPVKAKYQNAYGEYCFDFEINTASISDGRKTLDLINGGNTVFGKEIFIDNVEPFYNKLDGDLNYYVTADGTGGELAVPEILSSENNTYSFAEVDVLATEGKYGMSDIISMKQRDPEGEAALGEAENGYVSTTSDTTDIPYQVYEVDAKGKSDDILLNYKGNTVSGERLIMQVYNPTSSEWETIARGDDSGKDNTFSVKVSPAAYKAQMIKSKSASASIFTETAPTPLHGHLTHSIISDNQI